MGISFSRKGIFFFGNHRKLVGSKKSREKLRGSYDEMWIQQPRSTWVFMARKHGSTFDGSEIRLTSLDK